MKINIAKNFFTDREQVLVEHGGMKVTAFRYSTGVEALKVENEKGYFINLPFKGQQIWKLHFCGRDLSMDTTIKEPVITKEYLKTYGGFLYHCGVSSMGAPDATHPHHGEIPNEDYQSAYIECGEDENGKYITVGGELDYDIAFVKKYKFAPSYRLYENDTVLKLNVSLENMRCEPLEYAYLCHINFLPIDGAKLVYNAESFKVHKVVSDSLPEEHKKALAGYMDRLQDDPKVGDVVGAEGQCYDPEICCTVIYKTGADNRAYTLQYVEGEGACYVNHPADVLPYGIRWISRTGTENSMGMVLPATAEHLGYEYTKANGQLKYLPGKEKLSFTLETGWLDDERAKQVMAKM